MRAAYLTHLCNLSMAVLLCLLSSGTAHAEGGCPPGERPINTAPPEGSAASMASCMPYEDSTPAPRWASRWGAVAGDSAGTFGISENEKTQKKAEKAALAQCKAQGGTDCIVAMHYVNQCLSIATSTVKSNVARAPDVQGARQDSLQGCSRGSNGQKCSVFYSGCSLPVRVR